MELQWLGAHRPLIEDLFYWSNVYASGHKKRFPLTAEISLSASEIQVVEYLLENEELQLNMAGVARRLGVSPVSFTNLVSRLEELGLVEKYYREGDRKSLIVLVTARGREIYGIYSRKLQRLWEKDVLSVLDEIPEEYQHKFRQVLRGLSVTNKTEKRAGRPLTPAQEKE